MPKGINAGKAGEDLTAKFYAENGYDIAERNWRWSNKGEIDLIAYHRETNILVICEVKTRSHGALTRPCEAVNAVKQKKLRILAEVYLLRHTNFSDCGIRFDVAEVYMGSGNINHINIVKNAF